MPSMWVWTLAAMATLALTALLVRSGAFWHGGWMIAALPLLVCALVPVIHAMGHDLQPLDAYSIETGPCPGRVGYNEIKATWKQSVQNITAAFILNGWSNITVEERGHDGFWSSTYSVVAARCTLTRTVP